MVGPRSSYAQRSVGHSRVSSPLSAQPLPRPFLALSTHRAVRIVTHGSIPPSPLLSFSIPRSRPILQAWVQWLSSQRISPSITANRPPVRPGKGGGSSGGGSLGPDTESEGGFHHPYRSVFVTCENMEAGDSEKLYTDLSFAVLSSKLE